MLTYPIPGSTLVGSATVAQVLADRPVDPVTLGKTRNGFLNTNCDPKSLAEDRKANPPAAGETQTAMEKVCGWSFPIKLDAQFLDWNLMAKARELQVDSANYQYNLGLGLLMVDKPQQALEAAHKAYALGHPLPGLRNKLQRIGAWRPQPEPAPEDPPGTAAPPANTGANASGAAAAAPGAAATRAGE